MKLLKNIFPKKLFKKKAFKKVLISSLVILGIPLIIFALYNIYFFGLIFPNTSIAGVNISALSSEEAASLLAKSTKVPQKIVLVDGEEKFEIETAEIGLAYDYDASAKAAFDRFRTGNILYDFGKRFSTLFTSSNMGLRYSLDEEKLNEVLSSVATLVAEEPVYPSVSLVASEVLVEKGKEGSELDRKTLRVLVGSALAFASEEPIALPLKKIDPRLTSEEAKALLARAETLKAKTLSLKFEFQVFNYKGGQLFPLLDARKGYNDEEISSLSSEIAKSVNRDPQDSVFIFEGGRVQEFAPSKDGITVKVDELNSLLVENLTKLETAEDTLASIEIPVEKEAPKIATGDVNNLGIKKLIGRGTSRFAGSIANRIHNISLASSRFKGVLLAPGETFSFNRTLGDVSLFTGYKQAYVIKDGKTILGDGGGVCQVSTTLFRALLNAGLPIIERRAHSYRVGYYEQDSPPGLDATVYDPTSDLKFQNDTPGHILIQTIVDTKKMTLAFEIYGTDDGRIATISKPVTTNVVPPPEDLYQDDPTLPAGTVKQIEYKAWGAKVTFNYRVERGGEVLQQKTFVSNYRPWQAVYLRGTGPAQ
jgi:vancomycin resistance protein YoaR